MKIRNLLSLKSSFIGLGLIVSSTSIHAEEWVWAEQFGGGGGGLLIRDVFVDGSGSSYVTGLFAGTVELGPETLEATGLSNIFVAKVDADGHVVWANRAGGPSRDEGGGVVADVSGNVYVTGWFEGSGAFGPVTLTSNGGWNRDAFLVKYNSSGDVEWARNGGGSGSDRGQAVAVDAGGNPYITGSFTGSADFGGVSLVSAGGSDLFVAGYDTDGNVQWATRAGSNAFGFEQEAGQAIAVDDGGRVFVAGHFNGNAAFGAHALSSAGRQDMFAARFDPSTQGWAWAVSGGGSGADMATRLALDPEGNVIVAGYFAQAASFGELVLTSDTAGGYWSEDFFLSKYDADGELVWLQQNPGTGDFRGDGLTVDGAGNIYVAGTFGGNVSVGDQVFASSGYEDFYVARIDASGTSDWAIHVPGSTYLVVGGLGSDAAGNVYIGGWFQGSAEFGENTLAHSGGSDSFLAKLQLTEEPELLLVDFVIRPGSDVNPLNRRSKGVLPAAILGSEELDVLEIDVSSLGLWRADGVGGVVAALPSTSIEGAEGSDDGYPDLILKFSMVKIVDTLELSDLPRNAVVELVISGAAVDGEEETLLEGSDAVLLRQ